jgi:hypothetical protein
MERSKMIALANIANTMRTTRRAVDSQMKVINSILEGYGVESIRGRTWDNYFTDSCALYVNMGDTYALTIIYDVPKQKFVVTTWGQWVEKYQYKYGIY